MNQFMKFLKKNNYMAIKLGIPAVVTCLVIIVVILAISSNENETIDNCTINHTETTIDIVENDTKVRKEETTSEEETTTEDVLVEEEITKEEYESYEPIITINPEPTKQPETTTYTETTRESETTVHVETTREQETTKQQQTTTQQQTTKQQQTTTQQQTTQPITTEPETTTEEETTEKLRGSNGIILEELFFYSNSGTCEKVPTTWNEFIGEDGDSDAIAFFGTAINMMNDESYRILGNEILLYNESDNTGSTYDDVVAVYGEPIEIVSADGGTLIYYRYLDLDITSDQVMYVIFQFGNEEYQNKLCAIQVTNKRTLNLMLSFMG